MRGTNVVVVSGNIGGKIVKGETKDNRSACSFSIASEGEKQRTTWVRINAYDRVADYCKDVMDKGVYCSVVGELMNRDGQFGELTEVRAKEVIFFKSRKDMEDDQANSNLDGED